MNQSKARNLVIVVIIILLLAIIGVGTIWFFTSNVIVESKIYPKNTDVLNLRGTGITVEHYNAVKRKLPDCDIYWDVPFQGGYYPDNTTELTIRSITDEEIKLLSYLEKLETIHAEDCEDYAQLTKLQQTYPDCQVLYTVPIDGVDYAQDASEITVANLSDAEVELLDYLPQLMKVNAEESDDYAQLAALQARRPECDVNYSVVIGAESVQLDTTELTLTGQSITELTERLAYLPQMEKVHLVNPEGDAETMTILLETYPEVDITCELLGVTVTEDGAEVDLSAITLTSLDEVDKYMAFYPDAQRVYLGIPAIDNDTIAEFREAKRAEYKVVWTVMCGEIPTRTDATSFQPVREGVYYFFDDEAYYLRYCEDLEVVDVGHMSLHDISWVEYLPNLKYLILAHTTVLDITPLSTCKNLIFLELDWTGIRDYTPLLGCTSLQDLNLGLTYGDATPISQMTWLKNLWWRDCSYQKQQLLRETLTETNMMFSMNSTVGNGWRKLPNYYAMRDILGMPYME